MKAICQTAQLQQALDLLRVESEKPMKLTMRAEGTELQLEHADSRMLFRHAIPATVQETGIAEVFAGPLETVVQYAHDDALSLCFHRWHHQLDVKGIQHRHSFNGSVMLAPRDGLIKGDDGDWYTFDAHDLARALRHVLFSAHQPSEERTFLHGALLRRHEGKDQLVATDGRRLAVATLACPAEPVTAEAAYPQCVIPYSMCMKSLQVIESIGHSTCRLRFEENRWDFECGRFLWRCRSPHDQRDFPDYLAIFPDPVPPLRVEVNREELLWALALVHASEGEPDHSTQFHVERGQMTLETIHAGIGRSEVQLPIQYDGPATVAAFNAEFIREGLLQTEERNVTFRFRERDEQLESVIIELAPDLHYLVMPMLLRATS